MMLNLHKFVYSPLCSIARPRNQTIHLNALLSSAAAHRYTEESANNEYSQSKRTAVVLLKMGGPDSMEAVKPYLFNFFNDPRIVSLPKPLRYAAAKFISTNRSKTSLKIYETLGGKSPLVENTLAQSAALSDLLNSNARNEIFKVFICMRYWKPFTEETVEAVRNFNADKVVLLPLYPQYSTTTTGSSVEKWLDEAERQHLFCDTKIVGPFHQHPDFLSAHSSLIAEHYAKAVQTTKKRPRVLFSAHALPQRIVDNGCPYAKQVEKTAELVAKHLDIPDLDWKVCYQSKIGPMKWLEPSTQSELRSAESDGIPIVLCPIAFVSEHSETLVELDLEFRQLIRDGYFFRVPTLGVHPQFIQCLADLCVN